MWLKNIVRLSKTLEDIYLKYIFLLYLIFITLGIVCFFSGWGYADRGSKYSDNGRYLDSGYILYFVSYVLIHLMVYFHTICCLIIIIRSFYKLASHKKRVLITLYSIFSLVIVFSYYVSAYSEYNVFEKIMLPSLSIGLLCLLLYKIKKALGK